MSIEKLIADAVINLVKIEIEGLKAELMQKNDDSTLINTEDAAKLFGCSDQYIRNLQDKGILDLVFLPGSKHRRVKKSQILELIEKNTVKR